MGMSIGSKVMSIGSKVICFQKGTETHGYALVPHKECVLPQLIVKHENFGTKKTLEYSLVRYTGDLYSEMALISQTVKHGNIPMLCKILIQHFNMGLFLNHPLFSNRNYSCNHHLFSNRNIGIFLCSTYRWFIFRKDNNLNKMWNKGTFLCHTNMNLIFK